MTPIPSAAEVERRFVGLPSPISDRAGAGGHPCQGLWWTRRGRSPRVAVIATHYNVDFSEHYLAEPLAARGLGFLGWNTRFRGDETHFLLDQALVEIGVGVRWLRDVAGVDHVVLLGNSGGGSLMAAYQSEAVAPVVRPAPGLRLAAGIDRLIAGDAYISLAAHPGRPEVLTAWMDPSVVDESRPGERRSAPGSVESRSRSAILRRIPRPVPNSPTGPQRPDHRLGTGRVGQTGGDAGRRPGLHGAAVWADPRMVDPTLEPTNRPPNTCYAGDPHWANYSVWGIGTTCTLRSWLSMWSLETSQCQAAPHLAKVTVPGAGDQRRRGHGRVPQRRRRDRRRLGGARQDGAVDARRPLLPPARRSRRRGGRSHRRRWIGERFAI